MRDTEEKIAFYSGRAGALAQTNTDDMGFLTTKSFNKGAKECLAAFNDFIGWMIRNHHAGILVEYDERAETVEKS